MLYEDVHRKSVLIVLFVDGDRFLVQTMVDGNLCNLANIVILELGNVVHDLAL